MYITYVNHDSVIKQICQLKGNAYLINETVFLIQLPIVQDTARKLKELVNKLYRSGHIDLMTHKWLTISLKQPRTPEFYTLTKIHKKTPESRPIVSGSSGTTERISRLVDSLLQSIAIEQKSYIKNTSDFINFIENTQIPDNAVLATLDVSSLHANIPQDEGIRLTLFAAIRKITTSRNYLSRQASYGNSFKANEKHFLQTQSIAMGNKMARSLSPLFSCRRT